MPEAGPVPAVKGGAIEELLTILVEQNEIEHRVQFMVFCADNEQARAIAEKYKYSKIIYLPKTTLADRLINRVIRYSNRIIKNKTWIDIAYYRRVFRYLKEYRPDAIVAEGGLYHEFKRFAQEFGKENVYLHIFNNTRRLIASCDEQGLSDYGAMMRVVQAYAIQMLTDAYGPVAYSSVIEDPTGGASFSYDTQESVYNALFTLVDEAIAGFKGTASVADMQAFDYWCNGDIALWKKVANQLKLRLAMRIVKVNPTLAKQKAEEAVQGGVLTSADRDILINQGLSNELTRMFEWGDCGMNASLITMLEGFKDPRLPLYVTKNQAAVTCEDGSTIEEGTKYLGVRGGCNLPSKPNQWGNFSKVICTYTTAFPVMKVAEGYFLRAEGALRGWSMGGSAKDLYEEGIRISIKNELAYKGSIAGVTSISDAEIDAYLNGTSGQIDFVDPVKAENSIKAMNTLGVKWDEGASKEEKLQRIITQKWIANFPLSCEAWAEYRRTGYPKLFPNRVNLSNGDINTNEQVRRLIYSDTEINTNNAELQKGIELLNQENTGSISGDKGGTHVWWDKAGVGNF